MNSRSFVVLFCISLSYLTFAQDIITKRDGVDIEAKVLEVSDEYVKYKKFDYQDGPTYNEKTSEILMIRYENGSKDIFLEKDKVEPQNSYKPEVDKAEPQNTYKPKVDRNGLPIVSSSVSSSDDSDYATSEDGANDALRYYRAQNTGAGWTGATAALTIPIIGLIPAVACSSTPPKDFNLNYPESDLMDNSDYASGYRYEAHRIKKKKVWTGFAVGTIIWSAFILSVYN